MTRSVCLVVSLLLAAPSALAQAPAGQKTLYERLGGYDTIARIVDDFLPRLGKDPQIAPLVASLAMTSRKRNRQLIVDQLCEATGGPCFYIGRTMEASHQGLGITEDHWKRSGALMMETLDKFKIGEPERGEFLGLIDKLRADIVDRSKPAPVATPQP